MYFLFPTSVLLPIFGRKRTWVPIQLSETEAEKEKGEGGTEGGNKVGSSNDDDADGGKHSGGGGGGLSRVKTGQLANE